MKKVIIGSSAIKHHFPDFTRKVKDIDYAVDVKDIDRKKEITKIEGKNVEYLYNPILFKWINDEQKYLTPSQLLTLKMSHISWKVNFKKHMYDIQFLLDKGIVWNEEMYKELYDFWLELKGRKGKWRRSDLTLSSEEFFDNGIESDHDHLHTLINKNPTYRKILKDDCDVETCPFKFEKLSYNEKISLVQEEVMVMAYERFRHKQYRVGFNMMLEKFITGHCPIWQLKFIILNFKNIREVPFNYYKKIEKEENYEFN